MSANRTLWVEDEYAPRCRRCNARFTLLRRRHHCRQCGQVFCGNCLIQSSSSVSNAVISAVTSWIGVGAYGDTAGHDGAADVGASSAHDRQPAKLCYHCATLLARGGSALRDTLTMPAPQQATRSAARDGVAGRASPARGPAPVVAADGSVSSCEVDVTVNKPAASVAAAATRCNMSSSVSQGVAEVNTTPVVTLSASPITRHVDPNASCHTALSHNETAEERLVTFCVEELPPVPPPPLRSRSFFPLAPLEKHNASTAAAPASPTSVLPSLSPSPASSSLARSAASLAALTEDEEVDTDVPLWRDAACGAHLQARLRLLLRRARHEVCRDDEDEEEGSVQCSDDEVQSDKDEALVRRLADVVCEAVRSVVVPLGSHVLHHLHIRSVVRYEDAHDGVAAGARGSDDWAGGLEMRVVPGLVVCRAVTSRRMRTHIVRPRLLVLAGEVSSPVQPTDDLLEYVISYKGYLDKLFARIKVWRPDVIVVEKGMHHYLQTCIADAGGMTLLLHVGEAQMRQLAVACGASIVSDLQYVSLEEVRNDAVLGRCAQFDVVAFRAPRSDGRTDEQPSSVAAATQDVHMCVFQGLPCPVYVTVLLRSPSRAVLQCLKRLVRAGVVVAQHIAMQQHLLHDLGLRAARTLVRDEGEGGEQGSNHTAALTMNVGLRWPDEVEAAMRVNDGDDDVDRCRDSLIVNTVLLDRLYRDAGEAPSRAAAALGETDALLGPASTAASPVVAANGTPLSATVGGAAVVAGAAVSYSVQQRRGSMHFYGARDESLLSFLSARCAQGGSQLLFVHGPCRVLVTTVATPPTAGAAATAGAASSPVTALQGHAAMSAAASNTTTATNAASGGGGVAALRSPRYVKRVTPSLARQQQRWARSQQYARQLRHYRALSAAAAGGAEEDGVWGPQLLDLQRMQGLYCGCGGGVAAHAAAAKAMTLSFCSPHSLNVSLAAFLEFVIYGLPHCRRASDDKTAAPLGLPCSVAFVLQPGEEGQVEVRLAISAIAPSRIDLPLPCAHYRLAGGAAAAREDTPPSATPGCHTSEDDALYLRREKDELLAYLDAVQRAVQALQDGASAACLAVESPQSPHADDGDVVQANQQLARRTAELQTAAREVGSVDDVTSLRWRQLRPLVRDVLVALRSRVRPPGAPRPGETSGAPAPAAVLAAALATPQLWYCAETGQDVRVSDVGSVVALALTRWWQQAGWRPEGETAPHPPRTCPSCATVCNDESAAHPLLASRSSSAAATEATRESDEKTRADDAAAATRESRATMSEHDEDDGSSSTVTHVSLRRTLSGASRGHHTRYVFSELFSGSGGCEDSQRPVVDVELLFAGEFAALQTRYTQGHPECLLASLRHSRTFRAEGGKTRADFFITEDKRYLLKRIKPMELRHFSTLGAHYFRHLQATSDGDDAADATSALGKILGLYTIRLQAPPQAQLQQGVKSETLYGAALPTLTEPQCYVLMEYLFHDCAIDAIYDLKGSQRNRTTGDGAAVRLDVDLVQQLRQGNFLFCSEEDKARLMRVVQRDVGMLTEAAVMDYSLVAACDRAGRRIQVGIIDYLHPYNSVKVLESKVKSGLDTVLGHSAHRPTIIDPDHYEQRFLRWLAGYFCAVPTRLAPC